jgi:integral membrane protein (TIGR00529 family)
MPGGALLSAPFIEPEANRLGLDPEHKTYYNVWFRHLLYWTNPITPSTIMATTLTGISITEWLRVQSPLFFVMTGIGFYFSRSFIQRRTNGPKPDTKLAWKGVAPILLSVVLTLVGLPVWLALISGILLGVFFGKMEVSRGLEMFYRGVRFEIILSAAAMLFLRNMIVNTRGVDTLFDKVLHMGIPIFSIVILISLFIGAISGSPAMGVGISFPILLPLLGTPNIHYISMIYVGITCAYITSPLHLCLALTNSYYKSDLNKVIRYLAPSSLVLYLVGMLYHYLLNLL